MYTSTLFKNGIAGFNARRLALLFEFQQFSLLLVRFCYSLFLVFTLNVVVFF